MDSEESNLASKTNPEFVCEICAELKPSNQSFPIKGCEHAYCNDCMAKYVASKLQENISNIVCPASDCESLLEAACCGSTLPKEVFDKWLDALCKTAIIELEKFYCPYKDCSEMMIIDENECIEESECLSCRKLFCAQCKVPWHSEINCEEFQKLHKNGRDREDIMFKEFAEEKQWKRCPNCRFYVERTQGCRYIKCRCGAAFCYGCGDSRISRDTHYCPTCKA